MQALLKLLDKTTIAHQAAVIKQLKINQQELKLYIQHTKFNDGHGINPNDLLLRMREGAMIIEQFEGGYYDNARGVLAENY
jgi:hypothetical protein